MKFLALLMLTSSAGAATGYEPLTESKNMPVTAAMLKGLTTQVVQRETPAPQWKARTPRQPSNPSEYYSAHAYGPYPVDYDFQVLAPSRVRLKCEWVVEQLEK